MTTNRSHFQAAQDAGTALVLALASSAPAELVATCGFMTDVAGAPPSRIELLPAGTVKPNDGRDPWRLEDANAVVQASLSAAPHGVLAIDYDHAADLAAPKGGAAPAAGWITNLHVAQDGGIWGDVEWTEAGAKAITSKEYRFVSPCFLHRQDRTITRLVGAALVNRPALPQLTALAHAHGDHMDPILAAVLEALGLPKSADQTATLSAISALKAGITPALCAAAGLEATATADQIAATVTVLKGTASQVKAIAAAAGLAETASAPEIAAAVATLKANASTATLLETQVATLSSRIKALEGDKLAQEVDAAIVAGKFTPAQRGELLAVAAADRAIFDRLVKNAVPVLKPGETAANPPPADGGLTAEQKAVCAAMNISEEAYKATLGLAKKEG